jgi:predicted small lipoprotein YifL
MAGLAVAGVVALAACGGKHPASSYTPPPAVASDQASARADAQAFLARCVPSDVTAQAKLGHELVTDTKKHPNGSWDRLLGCAGVDKNNEQAVKDQAVTAAEHVNWASKPARDTYFQVTLFQIVQKYASIPGVTPSASRS